MLDIYTYSIDAYTKKNWKHLIPFLSSEEQEQLKASKMTSQKIAFVLSRLLLPYALKRTFGLTEYSINRNEWGKPYLVNPSHLHFNISHSEDYVVIALSDEEVGIDIEKMKDRDILKLADKYFTPEELNAFHSGVSFYDLWTKKESYVKLIGKGLTHPLKSVNTFDLCVKTIHLQEEYALSVCLNHPIKNEHMIAVHFHELIHANPFLIFLDLDGTVLNDEKVIPPLNQKVIEQIVKLGHKIIVSTGRAYYASSMYYHQLGLNSFIINRNGAHIHNPLHPQLPQYSSFIPKEDIEALLKSSMIDFILECYIEVDQEVMVYKGDLAYFSHGHYQFQKLYNSQEIKAAQAVVLLVENNEVDLFHRVLSKIVSIRFDVWKHEGQFDTTLIEIFPKDVDKKLGMSKLCTYYGIPIEHTLAMGDHVNDSQMLEFAHVNAVPKNAIESVKQHAKFVSPYTNNEGAVGKFLSSFFCLEDSEQ